MAVYVPESFTSDEADVLRRYFTNLDGPVFALVNLPEVVKGALFARYSRSPKSLRRLFLDEFVGDLDIKGDQSIDATIGLDRAEELYERVFFDYGDDSVAQLGGVHLACEQASNLLTKVLEWGRLMSYLEQSTRYIAYDSRLGGRYRYHRDPTVLAGPLGTRYVGDQDRMFDSYSQCAEFVTEHVRTTVARGPDDSEFVYRTATRAKALDAVRGMLPAAATSNVGIYGTGQAFEALLLEVLSDFQVSIPELGTIEAVSRPLVILTSNGVRELSDALRRRCLYHYLAYPDEAKERDIVRARLPEVDTELVIDAVRVVQALRERGMRKTPGIAETLDWTASLVRLGVRRLDADPDTVAASLTALVKTREDRALLDRADGGLAGILAAATAGASSP